MICPCLDESSIMPKILFHIYELGEPGFDLDDDGLPGEPLPPLPQEVELYPSQELDPNYQAIRKEKVYL